MKYGALVIGISFYGSLLLAINPSSNNRRKCAVLRQFVDIHLEDCSNDAVSLQVIVESQEKQPRRKKIGRSYYTKIRVSIEQLQQRDKKKTIKIYQRL